MRKEGRQYADRLLILNDVKRHLEIRHLENDPVLDDEVIPIDSIKEIKLLKKSRVKQVKKSPFFRTFFGGLILGPLGALFGFTTAMDESYTAKTYYGMHILFKDEDCHLVRKFDQGLTRGSVRKIYKALVAAGVPEAYHVRFIF